MEVYISEMVQDRR